MLIYKVTNLRNGKAYIGQTTRNSHTPRWLEHQHRFALTPLSAAIRKYGAENFKFEILIAGVPDKPTLDLLEMRLIKIHQTRTPRGYNLTDGGDHGSGYSGDDHWTRHKPSRIARGSKNGNARLTAEQVRDIRRIYATSAGMCQARIARQFGVTRGVIWGIVKGVSYRDVV